MEPEKAMQRKRRKNELKKDSKRRRMLTLRPHGRHLAAKTQRMATRKL